MEAQKEIPIGTELSSDDLLSTFRDIFGQSDELIKQWFPIFDLEQELTYTFETDKDRDIKPPEGALLSEVYNVYVKDESGETVMTIYMMPTVNPEVVTFAWDIYDEALRKEIGGKVPVQFKL
ncbi:hypothetical protein ACFLZH_03020 [Patescibacteria group bacterium]